MTVYSEEKIQQIDSIDTFGTGSIYQHGYLSNRVYLMKLHDSDFPEIIEHCTKLARKSEYTKLFCKVPFWAVPAMKAEGFITEAQIPDFYNGSDDVFFLAKYLNSDRLLNIQDSELVQLTKLLRTHQYEIRKTNGHSCVFPEPHKLSLEHISEIVHVYDCVFDSYPFPIFDPAYISKTMDEGVVYFGIFYHSKLIAVSSAEVDYVGKNAEMTDFAILPDYRGNGLAVILLQAMEMHMKELGILLVYTISRLKEPAITKTFLRNKYRYAGTLYNNTHISGSIESMNVFYKKL